MITRWILILLNDGDCAVAVHRSHDHLIDTTFSDVEKFESSNRCRYTLQSLYAALDHQLQDGLMAQHEFDRMRYIVRMIFDLQLQIHASEAEPSLPSPADVIGHPLH